MEGTRRALSQLRPPFASVLLRNVDGAFSDGKTMCDPSGVHMRRRQNRFYISDVVWCPGRQWLDP